MPATKTSTPSSTQTWALFLTAHVVLVRAIQQRLKDAGMPSLEWYDVLWTLERAPDHRLRMHTLAERLVVARFNLTRLVDRLARAGLVARQKSKEDRRGAYAVLTEKGHEVRKKMWPVYLMAISELFNRHINADSHAGLAEVFQKLIDQ